MEQITHHRLSHQQSQRAARQKHPQDAASRFGLDVVLQVENHQPQERGHQRTHGAHRNQSRSAQLQLRTAHEPVHQQCKEQQPYEHNGAGDPERRAIASDASAVRRAEPAPSHHLGVVRNRFVTHAADSIIHLTRPGTGTALMGVMIVATHAPRQASVRYEGAFDTCSRCATIDWRKAVLSAPVAQGIEQLPSKQWVAGSNPAWGTCMSACPSASRRRSVTPALISRAA